MRALLIILSLFLASGCSDREHQGVFFLRWMEKPVPYGPSAKARPEDQVAFVQVTAHDSGGPGWEQVRDGLRVGDVLAFRMKAGEATRSIATGHLNHIAYGLYRYGHLAIVVEDPAHPGGLTQFSSESFRGPNTDEGIELLKEHSIDVYRLDRAERINRPRLAEFVRVAHEKAGHWYGYDFIGMFGIVNAPLHPETPEEVGRWYICSTTVLAALHYAGIRLDCDFLGGIGDLVTPAQVVASRGQVIPVPEVRIEVQQGMPDQSAAPH